MAVAFDEVFCKMEVTEEHEEFEGKVAELMRSKLKTFNVDRLWSASLVYDRMLKTVQVTIYDGR